MNKKFAKILGVGLSLVLTVTLALAVAPVSAATLGWSTVSAPSAVNGVMIETDDVDFLVMSADGQTMFAYGNNDDLLWKSTNGGKAWTTTNIGTTLETNGSDVVGMAISPTYATDSTVVAATATAVFRSINGGTSFGEVGTAELVTQSQVGVGGVVITSVACANYYLGGTLAILVGTADATADQGGGVFLFRTDTIAWTDQEVGNTDYPASGGGDDAVAADVYAVAFSPNHQTDGQILAVVVGTTGTTYAIDTVYLTTKFGANAWAADILDTQIGTAAAFASEALTYATMAFPADYEWSATNRVLVGIESSMDTTSDDVFRCHGGLPGGASTSYDLNVGGSSAETEVHTIAISGDITGATVFVGQKNSLVVKKTTDPTLSTVTWSTSAKSPTGYATAPEVTVLVSPNYATDNTVYAATGGGGAQPQPSAVSRSTDGGVAFNQIGLVSVSDLSDSTVIDLVNLDVVDANTIFLVMADTGAGAGAMEMLWRTTDGGTSWERVLTDDDLAFIQASPTYADDGTVYVAENGNSRIWKSTNNGERWVGLAAPAAITAFTLVDATTYFTGHSTTMYKSGHWNSGTIAGSAVSIALSPDFASDDTVFVGTNDGSVYRSTNASATAGVTYNLVGSANELGAGANVQVACDPAFATNKIIYAGSSTATVGVMRWKIDDSVTWLELDTDGDTLVCSALVVPADGSLYAASGADDEKGVRRSLAPTGASATQWGFEGMIRNIPGGSQLSRMDIISGSNVIYALSSDNDSVFGTYEYDWRLITFTDTLAVAPVIIGPAAGAETGTSVTLEWNALESPITVTYAYEIATDANFANKVTASTAPTTTGTSITYSGLTAGTKYWWRVYSNAASPLSSKKAVSDFVVRLGSSQQNAELSAPAPGATNVSLQPTFQWDPVAGANSYLIEVADNPEFTGAATATVTTSVWLYPDELEYSTVYYWRVKAIGASAESQWSNGVFTTMAEPTVAPTTTPTETQPPIIIPATIPAYLLWTIVGIGAVLVIAVIVLIVRTRRVV